MTPTDPETVPEGEVSSPRELAWFIVEKVRAGEMWVGWSAEGRPAFGDPGEVPDGVLVVGPNDPENMFLLSGIAYSHIVRQSALAEREALLAQAAIEAREREALGALTKVGNDLVLPPGYQNRADRRSAPKADADTRRAAREAWERGTGM